MASVTVITATTGRPTLAKCIKSVSDQRLTEPDQIQHLIFVDGRENFGNVIAILNDRFERWDSNVIFIPEAVGKDRWNGHRMYGAGTFLAKGDYVMYLDDDNTIDPNHIQSCLEAAREAGLSWSHSLRKVVDQQGNFLCNDDCESLGRYHTVMGPQDHLVDVNCYFLRKDLAVHLSPIWYRKAREPGVMEVDRALIKTLMDSGISGACTGQYTVNYAVGSTGMSVNADFFIHGNKRMNEIYKGNLPWRKK